MGTRFVAYRSRLRGGELSWRRTPRAAFALLILASVSDVPPLRQSPDPLLGLDFCRAVNSASDRVVNLAESHRCDCVLVRWGGFQASRCGSSETWRALSRG